MESFKFRCISVAKIEVSKGIFLKVINNNGPVELFIYGKKTPVDKMIYMEVSGFYKNANGDYLIVKNIDVLNRFDKIRGSFSRIAFAMSMIEISYKTKIGSALLLESLNMLEQYSHKIAFLWFLVSFLIKNGIFDDNNFTKQELATLNFILHSTNKNRLRLNDIEFKSLGLKLIKFIEDYASTTFLSLNLSKKVEQK